MIAQKNTTQLFLIIIDSFMFMLNLQLTALQIQIKVQLFVMQPKYENKMLDHDYQEKK